MLANLLHKIRCRIDEPYRIKKGFGLSPLRTNRELKALIEFCRNELMDDQHMRLNQKRRAIYQATIAIYEQPLTPVILNNKTYYTLSDIVDDHVGWFWN